jgi:hypothetical protein
MRTGSSKPLATKFAAVGEEEAFAGAEAADGVGDEDLAAVGSGGDAGGEDDGGAEEVAVFFDGFAGVEADADVEGSGSDSPAPPVSG